ncbi:hypothetical protein [uncultured Helicobacter sp.]|uniref:hypothetical protein n=1 Tax=uncultured Helicobacter sp. TaxID=175537 RepID=UPI0026301AB9|nr:hypothetical protein [uncultured Helicobacter sp.]
MSVYGIFKALNHKTLIQKGCFLTLSALLLSGCAKKFDDLSNTRVLKTCQTPITTYNLISVKSGDYNDLTLANTEVQQMVEKSLAQSGCFTPYSEAETNNAYYLLEVIFGNINVKNKEGGFLSSTTSDQAIFEVQLSFSKPDEVQIFRGKASIQNKNSQYLVIFGDDSRLNPNQIQITLQNAVNSAINEAIRNLNQVQKTKSNYNY